MITMCCCLEYEPLMVFHPQYGLNGISYHNKFNFHYTLRGARSQTMKTLVYGHSGWIGEKLVTLFEGLGWEVVKGSARIENYGDVERELDEVEPESVVNV